MNKLQNRLLGLDKIYELITVPGDFFEAVKRQKLGSQSLKLNEITAAYSRRQTFMADLACDTRSRWQVLLAHITDFNFSVCKKGNPAIHDLFELKSFIYHYSEIKSFAETRDISSYDLPDLQELFRLLDPEGGKIPSFRLSPLYSTALRDMDKTRAELSRKLQHGRRAFLDEARNELGISNLKEEFVLARAQSELIHKIQNSIYFKLSRENMSNLTFSLADSSETNRIKQELATLAKKIEAEEERVLEYLGARIAAHCDDIKRAVTSVKELGWDFALAEFALRYDCCIPKIAKRISLKQVRNLPLELIVQEHKRSYQKLDLDFSTGANLITGPNMGGKTGILKCMAQCAVLARFAIPLPAKQASLPLYDFVYYNHAGEAEDLSSFGSELVAFCAALKQAGRGLFLLDEFAKGTNPREGEALAAAVITHLSKSKHTTIAATHFTAPALLKGIRQYQIKGIDANTDHAKSEDLHERLRGLTEAMDYSLIHLCSNRKPPMDALRIAAILGMPKEILELAETKD
ncbi:MAG TPA: hypothetical protein DHW79_11655 [Candidatus Cloacimonas sp.]|nr:hypothetical protein [Candidatus Cloacimonas sp.]